MNKTFTFKYKHAGKDKEIDISAPCKEVALAIFNKTFYRKRTSFSVAAPLVIEIIEN